MDSGDGVAYITAYKDSKSPPILVHMTPSTSSRRLSSTFFVPTPVISASRRLSWISLDGRLLEAEESTSAKSIGGGSLGPQETVSWELFTPLQRVLLVAVVAVAVANSKKSWQIRKLHQSVQIRDEILVKMQQKLDDLCKQIYINNPELSPFRNFPPFPGNNVDPVTVDACNCSCHIHDLTHFSADLKNGIGEKDDLLKLHNEVVRVAEPEERRMSDLSDWCSSVTSSAELQLNSLTMDQDIRNLQKECEEKEAAIQKLTATANAYETANLKRIADLEDIIRRKNMIITKMRKDIVVQEQKVIRLTRLRRPSFHAPTSHSVKPPRMASNILFDMDSSSGRSSSDADSPIKCVHQSSTSTQNNDRDVSEVQKVPEQSHAARMTSYKQTLAKDSTLLSNAGSGGIKQRDRSPLNEQSMNQRNNVTGGLAPRRLVPSGDTRRCRVRNAPVLKEGATQRRWK